MLLAKEMGLEAIYGALTALVITLVIVVAVLALGQVKARAIQRAFPDAVVARTGRVPEFAQAVSKFHDLLHFDEQSASIPIYFTVVADRAGIVFWGNADWSFAKLPWSAVDSIEPTLVQEQARTTNGMVIVAKSSDGSCRLPLGILGRGPFGAFPQRTDDIVVLISRLDELRGAGS